MHGRARSRNGIGSSARLGVLTDHRRRRAQLVQRENAQVVGRDHHGVVSSVGHAGGNKKAAKVAGGCRDFCLVNRQTTRVPPSAEMIGKLNQ